ncbi:MAG: neutral/alkaline non-lysosomal ceramidase N-terminal domain-containing protein [Verrucomicrobia bacterium]|nr:neutral/alkaline non-lysosomal ceramidase N-terminal domain-containing protein [Verrucomicrobiota bacterium]
MSHRLVKDLRRREFLGAALSAGAAGLTCWVSSSQAAKTKPRLLAGEGVVDITPPLGIEMGGFHRKPGDERRIKGVRQRTAVRALVLRMGDTQVAICSMDIAAIGCAMSDRIRKKVAAQTGIRAENVRLCATHTHSTPGFCYLRQWGALPVDYMQLVEKRTVAAVIRAKADLASAEVLLGKTRVAGGNHNRTVKTCPADAEFNKDSTDAQRWLDTMLHALVFHRASGKRSLVWHHFSAHAVCFADEMAGPDWPGAVAARIRQKTRLEPSFLQGHAGDVNPGDGSNWRGEIEQTTEAITPALERAIAGAKPVQIDCLRAGSQPFQIPLDMELFQSWREFYRKDPSKCTSGPWVDAGFAADWFRSNADRDVKQTRLPVTLSAIQLGPIGLVFHPAELYSYYGLAIRRDSPLPDTLVVGYTDGIIGYLTDPTAYQKSEYAAMTVPKILNYPPFVPTAAAQMTAEALNLLKRTVA